MAANGAPGVELLGCGFNQDHGCFACGTSSGFRVYNCEPFKETFRREFEKGGIGMVEMLFRCNILALVGGGPAPQYPPNKVMIWDDHQGRCIGELKFRSQVRAVKLRRDRIVVALEHKVLVYNFADLRLLHSIETLSNPSGLVALSAANDQTVLACPGLHCGQVRVELYDVRRTKFIQAHTTALACLSLSVDGKLLATASDRGTLIRIFSSADGSKLQELRRGADPARIYSIAFSRGEQPQFVAVSSDKHTVHVFNLDPKRTAHIPSLDAPENGASSPAKNPVSALSFVSSILPVPYFASERSFAQYHLPEEVKAIVGFGAEHTSLVIVTASGNYYTVTFDPAKGGQCLQTAQSNFLEHHV
jgi:WD40 repeat protein